jgi:hypothetical protein
MLCASVRKKGSTEQCKAAALKGHTLCGRHARCKVPVLWADANAPADRGVRKIQALTRGWLLRKRLELAGPGVLYRKNLANDDDLMTGEKNIHPFDYFAFEENGHVWWFSFDTLWRWCSQKELPDNPYTRATIPVPVRQRLHNMWGYRQRHRIPLPTESSVFGERLRQRWTIVSQLFENYGYGDIPVTAFMRFSCADYANMFTLLHDDIRAGISDKEPWKQSMLRHCSRSIYVIRTLPAHQYIIQAIYTILLILMKPKNPHNIAFMVLSALYRC